MSETKDKALNRMSEFIDVLETEIDAQHAKGKCVPATNFAKKVCTQFGWSWPTAYHLITVDLSANVDSLTVKNGPNGGIAKKKQQGVDKANETS